jgi:hypothetical protein
LAGGRRKPLVAVVWAVWWGERVFLTRSSLTGFHSPFDNYVLDEQWLERVRKEVATKALTYNEGKATQPVRLSTLQAMTKARFRNFLSNLGFPHISNVQADVLFDAYDRKGVGALTVDDVRQDVQPASSRTSFITWEQERLADYLKSNPPPPPPPRPSSRDTSEEVYGRCVCVCVCVCALCFRMALHSFVDPFVGTIFDLWFV